MFLRLGVTSFGGPVAHLGYFREELVVRRRWASEAQYAELLALCQFLPGPASSQLGFALGLLRGGPLGAVAAWTAFTLPSALLIVLFAVGAVSLDGPLGSGLVLGLQAVAVAVVAHAVWGMARTLAPELRRILIAAAAAALALLVPGGLGQLVAIPVGLLAGIVCCRTGAEGPAEPLAVRVPRRAGIAALLAVGLLLAGLPILARVTHDPWAAIADAFTRAGALVFGGGHVVLPLLQAEPAIAAAVPPERFLAGYGAAQALPGPLFAFAAFLGFEMQPGPAAPLGALLALVAVFAPGLLLLVGVLPFWERLRGRWAARAALAGANAAVVGILAAALWDPVIRTGVTGVAPALIAAGCLLLLVGGRLPVWAVVLAGAVGGVLAGLLGAGTGAGAAWA
ncbi:chromate efflux transporter [Leucobacter allii]|uniref:Chromate efflux transporter n=1 Tax=Leucobacter allii TaxID=2932247 RepID=A0ABY4FPG9_9MICO|nr:chromate efflux transporter [Leucobacter allii]UOQ58183.1 chromate efflux transporter [Leucobacter allii]